MFYTLDKEKMYRHIFRTASNRSTESALRREREERRRQEQEHLDRILRLEREVERLRDSREGSVRNTDPGHNPALANSPAYINAVNDLIQLNQNELANLQERDQDAGANEDTGEDDIQIIDHNLNGSIGAWSFTEDVRSTRNSIQNVQIQQNVQFQHDVPNELDLIQPIRQNLGIPKQGRMNTTYNPTNYTPRTNVQLRSYVQKF